MSKPPTPSPKFQRWKRVHGSAARIAREWLDARLRLPLKRSPTNRARSPAKPLSRSLRPSLTSMSEAGIIVRDAASAWLRRPTSSPANQPQIARESHVECRARRQDASLASGWPMDPTDCPDAPGRDCRALDWRAISKRFANDLRENTKTACTRAASRRRHALRAPRQRCPSNSQELSVIRARDFGDANHAGINPYSG